MTDYTNPFDETRKAVAAARSQLRATDEIATDMARLLVGRLRSVKSWQGTSALADLKRELRDFNIQTKRWRSND